MPSKIPNDLRSFQSLIEIVEHLRSPEGCPWDREQTHQSLAPFAIEEVYEFVDTIESQGPSSTLAMKEELGDLLFQVVLHCQLAQEEKKFNIFDVLEILNSKMVRRHPHVFANVKVDSAENVVTNWEHIKSKEKSKNLIPTTFELPSHLPALQKSYKIGKKTEKTGFDWQNSTEVWEKVNEEIQELKNAEHLSFEAQEEELGDLLFAISQLSRHLKIEPETALRKANAKFEKRYFNMLTLAKNKGLEFSNLSSQEKEKLWQEIKNQK